MSVLAVIPARFGSTRFPGKPLARLRGKPVIQHVYERARQARRVTEVLVATDDARILEAVRGFGGEAALTSPSARSGTDRIAEVARTHRAEVILNVQGDEPLIQGAQLDQVAEFLERHRAVPMASLRVPLARAEDTDNPNVVKVVVDRDGYALYFSRAAIPYMQTSDGSRLKAQGARRGSLPPASSLQPRAWYKHLGLYGYQRHFLLQFPSLALTALEQAEQLEQLRALEHGYRIKVLDTAQDTVGIDTPEDLQRVEALMTRDAGPGDREPGSRIPNPESRTERADG